MLAAAEVAASVAGEARREAWSAQTATFGHACQGCVMTSQSASADTSPGTMPGVARATGPAAAAACRSGHASGTAGRRSRGRPGGGRDGRRNKPAAWPASQEEGAGPCAR